MAYSYTPHPDDEEMLLRIRRYLIGYRVTNGWNQQTLSKRINDSTHAAHTLEKGGFDWTLRRLQRWPEAFGMRLHAVPCFRDRPPGTSEMWEEIIEADEELSSIQAMLRTADGVMRHTWQRMYLTTYLKVAREKQKITRAELGSRLGITAGAISAWEISSDNVRLLRLLNHARALGGSIQLDIS